MHGRFAVPLVWSGNRANELRRRNDRPRFRVGGPSTIAAASVNAGVTVRVSNTTVVQTGAPGFRQDSPSIFYSFGNNRLAANTGGATTGTITPIAQQ
jgi:hypothetical protein